MIGLAVSLLGLVSLTLLLGGCDGGPVPIGGPEQGGLGGSGAEGGSGAQTADPTGGVQWRYDSDDEGVFPKDRVLDVQVTMPEEAWTQLVATATDEVWSHADVVIDGQDLGTVGFRPKGAYSLDTCVDESGQMACDKFSFKLKFHEIDPEGRFYGLKRLVLNQINDGWGLYAETLAYQVFNSFGIIAPRTSYAVLTVNGESLGIYRVVEVVDGRFTDHHFRDGDGNLYKEGWPVSMEEDYFASALKTNEETASHEAFIAFSEAMLAASDEELPQVLAQYTDVDQILDYMAVDYAIANWDGITAFYAGSWGRANHNFYMYQREGTSTFTLIPWDLNAVFFLDHWLGDVPPWDALDVDCETLIPTEDGSISTVPASCDPMIRAIGLSKEGYHASVRRLLYHVFSVDELSEKIDEYARQVDSVMQDDPFIPYADVSSSAGHLKASLPTMRERLLAVLEE